MATKFIPNVAKANDEAFRRILRRDFPNTYKEWLYLANKSSADNVAMGHDSKPVEVDPNEFTRYLRATGSDANLHSLYNFAYEKGVRNKY